MSLIRSLLKVQYIVPRYFTICGVCCDFGNQTSFDYSSVLLPSTNAWLRSRFKREFMVHWGVNGYKNVHKIFFTTIRDRHVSS